ncbi:hypothetical protein Patl1_26421 [Pistacia atlantica]|uniref:Uncharacterized protein n=1 Tax=Pistacia atlantica TaxID=434234 RepID=A0ACC1AYW1_9ROSI|nr:hypothetical protein Patl1_26421 [Pistacia atlantica]
MYRNKSLQLTDKWEDDYGNGNRQDHRYWHARREFLKSYNLSSRQNNEEKLRRSINQINEVTIEIVSDIRKGMSKRRIGFRFYRIKFALPSLVSINVGCFTPWLCKTNSSLVN